MSLRENMRYILAKLCDGPIIIMKNLPISDSNGKGKNLKVVRGEKRLNSITGYGAIGYESKSQSHFIVTSLHGWRKTHRAGKSEWYFDFKRLCLCAHVELHLNCVLWVLMNI